MINQYSEIKDCIYKEEHYSVRDNGAVMRHARIGKKLRKDDNIWTFGIKNTKNGYMHFGNSNGHRIHIIVATAFLGAKDSKIYVVDHIDTNRCNNRVENLRWFTKLENALNNEITRNKIIYFCGSIEAFIENPKILQERIEGEPSLDWMRTVTKEEAHIAYENIKKYWEGQIANPKPFVGGKINDSIYQQHIINTEHIKTISEKDISTSNKNTHKNIISNEEWEKMIQPILSNNNKDTQIEIIKKSITIPNNEPIELVQAKSPTIAWQKKWKTPTNFLCCPLKLSKHPIEEYFNNLIIDSPFCSTLYNGNDTPSIQTVVDKAYIENNSAIILFSKNPDAIKPYALSKIYLSKNKFIHESIGTFFHEDGARKYFTIEQGLEWTDGDTSDDFC